MAKPLSRYTHTQRALPANFQRALLQPYLRLPRTLRYDCLGARHNRYAENTRAAETEEGACRYEGRPSISMVCGLHLVATSFAST